MIYKTAEFAKLTKKAKLTDEALVNACKEMRQGLIDADLGSGLYKKRVAAGNKGKSGGYRTLVGAVIGNRYFFLYAFAKNTKSNINQKEALALKELASQFLNFAPETIEALLNAGELIKVGDNDE